MVVSLLLNLLIFLFFAAGAWAPSSKSPFEETFFGLVFPYGFAAASLLELMAKGDRPSELLVTIALVILVVAFLLQLPIYGGFLGYANVKGHLRRTFYQLLGTHVLFFVIASLISRLAK